MRADMIVAMMEGRDPGPTTFSIANGVKDLRTMVETGAAQGADMPRDKAALAGFRGSEQATAWAAATARAVGLLVEPEEITEKEKRHDRVTLAQASTIVDAALKKARELKQMPQTVVVLDTGGHHRLRQARG